MEALIVCTAMAKMLASDRDGCEKKGKGLQYEQR